MASFDPNPLHINSLNGQVIVLTGGANGIGAATVKRLKDLGAYVVFGDWDHIAGEKVVSSLASANVSFMKMDVAQYDDNLALFELAFAKYRRVDHAMAIAGIVEQGNWFDPGLTLETIKQPPPLTVLDVNLKGVLYFARVASVYLRQNRQPEDDRSLLLLSSIAGFKETPGLFVYQAAKHGVLGLMRSLRLYVPEALNIRVNAICPWMTATQVVAGIEDAWYAAKLPVNQPADVAEVLLNVTRSSDVHGKAFYMEGGRAWEIEDNIDRLEPQWLGERQSRDLARGQETLGNGTGWTSKQ